MSELDKLRMMGQQAGIDFDEVAKEIEERAAKTIEARLATKLSESMDSLKMSVAESLNKLREEGGADTGGGNSPTPTEIRGMVQQETAAMKDQIIEALRTTTPQNGGGGSGGGFDWEKLPQILSSLSALNQPQSGGLDNAITTLEKSVEPLARLQQVMAAMQPPQPGVDTQFRASQNAWMLGFKEGARAKTSKASGEVPKVPSGQETIPEE